MHLDEGKMLLMRAKPLHSKNHGQLVWKAFLQTVVLIELLIRMKIDGFLFKAKVNRDYIWSGHRSDHDSINY